MKKLLLFVVIFSIFTPIFSETNNQVAIVYNGKSAVNRETSKYLIKQSSKVGLDYTYKVLRVNAIGNISDYKSVIILNTGIKNNNIDPVIKTFIDESANKTNFILLTFNTGQNSLEAKLLTGDQAINGVDGISSASIYKGGQNTDFEWFDMLVKLLDGQVKK